MEGDNFSILWGGDTAVMRGDIELMGWSPPVPPLGKTLLGVTLHVV